LVEIGLSVPLYNEEALVSDVVTGMVRALEQATPDFRIALVNNGSSDATGTLIDQLAGSDARLVPLHLPQNAGYGGGILAGIRTLQEAHDPLMIGWAWGDGQIDAQVLVLQIAAIQAGARLAKTHRTKRHDGLQRRIITQLYSWTTRMLGIRTPDVNGCPKLMDKDAYAALAPTSQDWFLDAEVVLGAEQQGWEIANIPTTMKRRAAGESKVSPATILEFARNFMRWRFRRR